MGRELLGYNPWVIGHTDFSFGLFPFFETRNFTGPTMCKNCPLIPPYGNGSYLRTPRLVRKHVNWVSFTYVPTPEMQRDDDGWK